jgi:hypothetical protein
MIDYDGRRFGPAGGTPGASPVAHYHQRGDLLWGEFSGGEVRRGSLAGTSTPQGALDFAYCMVLDSGEVVSGRCHSVPELLDDGRIRLLERWERYGPGGSRGLSALEELSAGSPEQVVGPRSATSTV